MRRGTGLTSLPGRCSNGHMQARKLQDALQDLKTAINHVEAVLDEMQSDKDPLAVHIFVSRRHYRHVQDTKSGKRRETEALISWKAACDLGFRGTLAEWERLMGATSKRWSRAKAAGSCWDQRSDRD